MSNLGLFVVGTFVTLLVLGMITLLAWGAVLDGRYDAEQRAAGPPTDPDAKDGTDLQAVDAA
jgi:hypothetical protein